MTFHSTLLTSSSMALPHTLEIRVGSPSRTGTGPDAVPENYVQPTITSGPLASRDKRLISLWLSLPGKKKEKKNPQQVCIFPLRVLIKDSQMWLTLYLVHFLMFLIISSFWPLFFSLSPISPNPCKNNKEIPNPTIKENNFQLDQHDRILNYCTDAGTLNTVVSWRV